MYRGVLCLYFSGKKIYSFEWCGKRCEGMGYNFSLGLIFFLGFLGCFYNVFCSVFIKKFFFSFLLKILVIGLF